MRKDWDWVDFSQGDLIELLEAVIKFIKDE